MRSGLLANFASHGLRLIGHELHGAHDAAPFGVEPIVVRADGFQELVQLRLAAAPARLGDLPLQQRVEALCRQCRLSTDCSRGFA